MPLGYYLAAVVLVWYFLRICTESLQWFDVISALVGFMILGNAVMAVQGHLTTLELWNVSAGCLAISLFVGVPLMLLHVMVFGSIKAIRFHSRKY